MDFDDAQKLSNWNYAFSFNIEGVHDTDVDINFFGRGSLYPRQYKLN